MDSIVEIHIPVGEKIEVVRIIDNPNGSLLVDIDAFQKLTSPLYSSSNSLCKALSTDRQVGGFYSKTKCELTKGTRCIKRNSGVFVPLEDVVSKLENWTPEFRAILLAIMSFRNQQPLPPPAPPESPPASDFQMM